jgi:flagellar protein FlaJ
MRKINKKIRQITAGVSIAAVFVAFLAILIFDSKALAVYANEIFFICILVIIVPTAILDYINQKWVDAIEDQLPTLVRGISESQETGLTLVNALDQVVENRMVPSPLADEVKRISIQMSWGTSFEDALMNFKERVNSPIVSRFCALVLEASRSGGHVKKVFTATSSFMEEMKEIDKETSSAMKPYIIVIYASFMVFIFISILLVQSFLAPFKEATPIMGASMVSGDYQGFFYQYMLISALTGGLMAGKLGERRVLGGLKHSIILSILGYAIFIISIPPTWM